MSREIKFRAWDKRHNIMEYINDLYWFEENGIHNFNDDNYIFMQNTGLKDKNGKEIYEGDILINYLDEKGCVIFNNGSFKVKISNHIHTPTIGLFAVIGGTVDIIGNIYDNPELLENKELIKL